MACTYCMAQNGPAEYGQSKYNVKCKVCRDSYCDDHTHSCCVNHSHTFCPICFGRRDLIEMCLMCDRPYCKNVCGVNNECSTCIKWSKDV